MKTTSLFVFISFDISTKTPPSGARRDIAKGLLRGFCAVVPLALLLAGTAAVGLGCRRDAPPPAAPQLTLPAAPGSPSLHHDPRMPEVTIDAKGILWFQGNRVTLAELGERLATAFKGPATIRMSTPFGCRIYRDPPSVRPVAIRADANLEFGTVHEVISLLKSYNLSIVNIVVLKSSPDIESRLMFHTSIPWQSEIVSEILWDIVEVKIRKSGLTMNGVSLSRDENRQRLRQLASIDRQVPVVIVPAADASYADFVALLEDCAIHGLDNVHVLNDRPSLIEDESPAVAEPRILPPDPNPYNVLDENGNPAD